MECVTGAENQSIEKGSLAPFVATADMLRDIAVIVQGSDMSGKLVHTSLHTLAEVYDQYQRTDQISFDEALNMMMQAPRLSSEEREVLKNLIGNKLGERFKKSDV